MSMEIQGLPDKVGVYVVIKEDGTVKLRVIYFNEQLKSLYVAPDIGAYGFGKLQDFKNSGHRWFGPLEMPAEPLARLNQNFIYQTP